MRARKQLVQVHDEGFTIIELLVVLVIIGILSGVAYVGLTQARNNSIQDSCKAAYQAVALGVASYQTDHGGYMPGSIPAMEPNYISDSTLTSYSKNFSLQLGSFAVTQYWVTADAQSGTYTANLDFAFSYTPVITTGEKIVVAGVAPSIDGTWQVLSYAPNPGSANHGTVSFSVKPQSSINPAPVATGSGAYASFISNTGDPFDVYVFDPSGKKIGTTAPAACSSL
jgi:prepilin-type N-terminal cleavage/methylation domain-containing protein